MVLMRLALRYSYGAGFEQAFPETDDLTRFIGTYTTYAAIGGIALQVIITPRLLRWLGVGLLNAVYSWIVAGALALSAAVPGLPAAVVARMTDLDLKSALKTPLSPMFYEALGEKDRKDGRAIILGIVSPLASLVSSLMLIVLTTAGISAAWIAGAGALVGVGFIVASHVQGRAYRASLEALLVDWHREHGAGADPTLDEAIEAALASGDRRIGDMAREIRRRR